MNTLIITSAFIAVILILWFKTEVWYEYTKIFGLGFLSDAKGYESAKHEDISLSYIMYLRKTYLSYFYIRMITCPICISFWLSFVAAVLAWELCLLAPAMIGGLLLYGLTCRLLDI